MAHAPVAAFAESLVAEATANLGEPPAMGELLETLVPPGS